MSDKPIVVYAGTIDKRLYAEWVNCQEGSQMIDTKALRKAAEYVKRNSEPMIYDSLHCNGCGKLCLVVNPAVAIALLDRIDKLEAVVKHARPFLKFMDTEDDWIALSKAFAALDGDKP